MLDLKWGRKDGKNWDWEVTTDAGKVMQLQGRCKKMKPRSVEVNIVMQQNMLSKIKMSLHMHNTEDEK